MEPTRHIVIGPPGTGKTTYLARQVRRAVDAGEAPTVVSLTRAAAKEAAGRNLPINDERVSTLHAQCYRALGYPDLADTDKGIKKWNEHCPPYALSFSMDIDDNTGIPLGGTPADDFMLEYQSSRAMMLDRSHLKGQTAIFAKRWEDWKKQEELLDFTDLLEKAITEIPSAPNPSSVIFVDESQDLSKLEMSVIEQWAQDAGKLIIVGDPWQCLYEWRGTDPQMMMGSDARVLSQSYRLPHQIARYALSWMEKMPGFSPIIYKARNCEGRVLQDAGIWQKPESGKFMQRVEADISAGKSVMLLTSCGYMLQPLIGVIRDRGIPFHNPYRRKAYSWNPLYQFRRTNYTAVERVLAFLAPSTKMRVDYDGVMAWLSVIKATNITVKRDDLKEKPAGALTPEWVAERVNDETLTAWFNGDLDWLESQLLKSGNSMRYPLKVAQKRGHEELENDPQLIIGTIHSVKGGEADSVYLFPDISKSGAEEWETRKGRAAIYRLFYVGITRAKETLTVMSPSSALTVPI